MPAPTTAHVLAIGHEAGRLAFATADAKGRLFSSGAFPSEAHPAGLVILADFSLLGRTELAALSESGQLGLLAPRRGARFDGPEALLPEDVLRLWNDSHSERVQIHLSRLSRATRFLAARASYSARMNETLDDASRLLASLFPDYFAALSDRGRMLPEALAIVGVYPTLTRLQSASTVQLTHTLDTALPGAGGRTALRQRVFELHQRQGLPEVDPFDREFAATMIPNWARDYTQFGEQRAAIDQEIYRILALDSAPRTTKAPQRDFSMLALSMSGERAAVLGSDTASLLARLESLLAERGNEQRRPQSAYEEYKLVQAALEQQDHALTVCDRIRIETVGQLLALSARHYLDAARHRRACGGYFEPDAGNSTVPTRIRADATIAMALTDVLVDDLVTRFAGLRAAIEGTLAASATPEILTEALGMFVLTLVFFGENASYPEAGANCREFIAAHGAAGPARAAYDIAELFIASGNPLVPEAQLEEIRRTADANSRNTAYRDYYQYVMMLAAYVTVNYDAAIASHTEMRREDFVSRFNPRINRLSRLSYALNLAAKGEFALAHRELAEIEHSTDPMSQGADELILELAKLRLEIAGGNHRNALARTMPDGPLSEEQLIGAHLSRYAPSTLCLRGTALMREGAVDHAADAFLRATQHSIMSDEWLGLLCTETPEYREWLAGLDRSRLPQGITEELLDVLLARPLFISLALPSLTPQHRRVLRMLAQGRSTNSIASELHVSPNTLKSHLRGLYQRLGVRSREQAVLRAESYGMLR